MTEFYVDIIHSGTLELAEGTRLTYAESANAHHSAHGTLYPVLQSDKLGVFVPHNLDDNRLQAWFEDITRATDALSTGGQLVVLPRVALARHALGWTVALLDMPTQTLQNALNAYLANGYVLKAERLALRAVMGYLHVLHWLYEEEPKRAFFPSIGDWHIVSDSEGNPQPCILNMEGFTNASELVPLHALFSVANTLMTWFTGKSPALPIAPFDDTQWQSRHAPYLPEGMVSVGLRYMLAILLHAPLHRRFTQDDQPSYAPLREAVYEWQRLIYQQGSFIDTQTPEALANWSACLPAPYRLDGALAEAIWLDLWWRVHLGNTLPHAKRTSQQTARLEALMRVRRATLSERDGRDTLLTLLERNALSDAKSLVQTLRESAQERAQDRDLPAWSEWQHWGRWQVLLAHDMPLDVLKSVGSALHTPPQEDTADVLERVRAWLVGLSSAPLSVLDEVHLRQNALALRQNAPQAWEARLSTLHADLARIAQSDTYLTLPANIADNPAVLPFTLAGQMVGQSAELLAQLQEALAVGNDALAQGVFEFLFALAPVTAERAQLAQELTSVKRIIDFLAREAEGANVVSHVKEGLHLLSTPYVSARPPLRERIERALMNAANDAFQRVQATLEGKAWHAIRDAYPCYRLLTERATRHPIEQLRVAYNDAPRSIIVTATLNSYERLHKTYQALFSAAKQDELRRATDQPTPDARAQAKAHLTLLQEALELGIPMTDILQADDAMRQAWQKMINDALETLGKVQHVTDEVQQLRQKVEGDDGISGQIATVLASLNALQAQVDGEGETPSLLQQLRALRGQLSDIERSYQAQLERAQRDMQTMTDEVQRQLEAQDIAVQRHTAQLSSQGNLLEDARERLSLLEHELIQIQKHEAQLLCTYLDAMPQAERLERINSVLDAIDGLMHALRRCPVEAYDEGCHTAWLAQFKGLQERFEALANSKLNWRDKRNLKNNIRKIRELFAECEAEAIAKHEAYKIIFTKPANRK
jgi:hypothetical protein